MNYVNELIERYPVLANNAESIESAISTLEEVYRNGGKILICGNGGSCADAEHISGELLKGFLLKRPLGESLRAAIADADCERTSRLLQGGIPAIPLTSLTSVLSAFANDVDPELVFAQLVLALGKPGDALVCLSTSGNSRNVVKAALTAGACQIKTVSLTGNGGGRLGEISDVCIAAPERETFKIQELHLPIYHAICAELERRVFGDDC